MSNFDAPGLTSEAIRRHLDNLTKPPGSLGRLEELAERLCTIQQTLSPETSPRRLIVFAGDHGVVASGVTSWPSDVTGLMIRNIRAGGAASSALAQSTRTELVVVNAGTFDEERPGTAAFGARPYRNRSVRRGTGNLENEAAVTAAEFEQALQAGRHEARHAAGAGMKVVAAGEMGIGNSTPAACLAVLLAEVPLEIAVGRGAGADEEILARKRHVVDMAVQRARQHEGDPIAKMSEVAGLEIVAAAGLFLEAHRLGLTIVLDGYIAGTAALIAEQLTPGVTGSMIAAHLSAEPGHASVLERLGLTPFLDWNLRLGEGTGALMLMPLLDAAAAMTSGMTTFQDLGISPEVKT